MFQKMLFKAFTTIIIGLIMSLTAVFAGADTPVGGPIFEDTTWTKEGSPYIVTAGVLVEEGVTLTIEPGVVVKFNYGKALQIDGCLIAQGTEDEPIIFTSNQPSPAPSDWGYILFTDTSVDATYDDEGNYTGGSIMQYCTVEYAGQSNPAVRVETSSPFVDYCIIKNNASIGVSFSNSSLFKITNCTISDNLGNGIYVSGSVLIVSGSTVSNNSASGSGGGIYASGTVTISSNTITNNSASGSGYIYGGGVYASGTATISDNTIANNSASCTASGGWGGLDKDGWGGGIYAYTTWDSTMTLSGNTIINNSASGIGRGWGGGIYLGGNVTVTDNIITNNSSSSYGGGICFHGSWGAHTNTIISGNIISNNSAPIGGGIFSYPGQAATITHNTITSNFVSQGDSKAGGIYISNYPTPINYNNIQDNTPYDVYNSNKQGTPDIDATNNWWGIDKSSEILDKIYDWYDDATLGKVDFTPYLLTPPGAPAAPEGLTITVADSIVTLNWTANTEPDLAGYKVYYGQNEGGPYDGIGAAEGDSPIDVGDVTTTAISGLPVDSATYYFVVTAYDNEDNESYFSNEVSNNTKPRTPTNQSPADGAEDVALSPTLEADAFFDADGDGHAASQWQVDVEGGGNVYDSGEDTVNLTSIKLPIALEPMTVYKWRVRYMDSRGRWSKYSTPTFFTTGCKLYPTGDVSGNGTVSAYDAALILKYVVGLLDEFPVDLMASPIDSPPRDYTVSAPKQSAKSGDKILIPISIDDATGLLAGGISLKYDPTVLKAVDFTAPSLLNGFYWKANINLNGEIRFAFASTEPAQGSGSLLMVEFEVMPNTEGQTTPLIFDGINLSNSLTIKRIDGAVTILPAKTALLPNFPNPFNPDTWIPYKLAQSANVAIQIYDVKGRLIRTLDLGVQSPGVYITKQTAAYWNGRDDAGEKVASGVYFYILQVEYSNKDGASKFRAIRKMAIMK
jgi:predicted outer membrane repeat protein